MNLSDLYNQLNLVRPEAWLAIIFFLLLLVLVLRKRVTSQGDRYWHGRFDALEAEVLRKRVTSQGDRYWHGRFDALEAEAAEHQDHLRGEIIWLRRRVSPNTPPIEPVEE